jgi:hypothetical protein
MQEALPLLPGKMPCFLSPHPTLYPPQPIPQQSGFGSKASWQLQNGRTVYRQRGQAVPAREGTMSHTHCLPSEMPVYLHFYGQLWALSWVLIDLFDSEGMLGSRQMGFHAQRKVWVLLVP